MQECEHDTGHAALERGHLEMASSWWTGFLPTLSNSAAPAPTGTPSADVVLHTYLWNEWGTLRLGVPVEGLDCCPHPPCCGTYACAATPTPTPTHSHPCRRAGHMGGGSVDAYE